MERNGYLAWEYYFEFGGGRPPWVSGMAQGTAMQALARAGERLADPALTQAGRRGLGAFEQRTPRGVRVPQSSGDWYALYSFAPQALCPERAPPGGERPAHPRRAVGRRGGAGAFPGRGRSRPAANRELRHGGVVPLQPALLGHRAGGEPQLPHAEPRLRAQPVQGHQRSRLLRCRRCVHPLPEGGSDARPAAGGPLARRGGRGVRFKFRLSKIGRVGVVVRRRREDVPVHQRVVCARRSLHPLGPAEAEQRAHLRVHAVRNGPRRQLRPRRQETCG